MSECGGLWKHKKDPACTLISQGWVARLCCSWLSLGKATRISHGRNSHWDNKVYKIQKTTCTTGIGRSDTKPLVVSCKMVSANTTTCYFNTRSAYFNPSVSRLSFSSISLLTPRCHGVFRQGLSLRTEGTQSRRENPNF